MLPSQLFSMTESPLSLSMMTDVLFMYSMTGLQNSWIFWFVFAAGYISFWSYPTGVNSHKNKEIIRQS